MAQVFSSIGGALSKVPGALASSTGQKALGLGSTGFGFLSDWLQQRRYNNIYNNYTDALRTVQQMTPQQLAAGINATTQPLSSALRQNIGNIVQADMATRGLSQAPGIFASAMAQALAPYQIKQQELGQQAFLQKLGLPLNSAPYALATGKPSPVDLSGVIQRLQSVWRSGNTASPEIGGLTFPLPQNKIPLPPVWGTGVPLDAMNLPPEAFSGGF